MKKPFISEPIRARVVKLLEKGRTYQEVADVFGIGPATVNRIWRRFRETGLTSLPPRGGGRRPKISPAQEGELRKLVESNPTASYAELTAIWRAAWKMNLSRSALVRKVLQLGYSWKRKSRKATEKNTKVNRAKRALFRFRIKSIPIDKLVFLDESGFQAGRDQNYARSMRGQKAVVSSSSAYFRNFTVAGAIRLSGPVSMRGSARAMSLVKFLRFLKRDVLPRLKPGDVLVMDNLRAHRNKAVRRLARAWDVRVIYLPPYCPELNPIEIVWGWMKKNIHRRANRLAHCFRYAIAGAWRKTSNLCFENLFRHCEYV